MPGKTWDENEIERLRELLAQGLSASEMQIGSRTPAAIQNKAARLNFVGDGISRKPWSRDDRGLLRRLVREGQTAAQIASAPNLLLGYSRNSIQKKLGRMSLADRVRSRRARGVIRLTTQQLERFHTFLLAHAARCTPEQIALLWSQDNLPPVSRRRVVYHLQKLEVKRSWAEVMQMPYSKAKQRRVSKKATSSRQRRWAAYRKNQEDGLKDLARRRRRASRSRGKSLSERVCRDCHSRWPATEPFFVIYSKVTSSGQHRYVGRICRMCRNRRRRESKARRGPVTV